MSKQGQLGKGASKEIQQLMRKLKKDGWEISLTKRASHWTAIKPGVDGRVTLSKTTSDRRVIKNLEAEVRRIEKGVA